MSRGFGDDNTQPELDLVQTWPVDSIRPAPENDSIYGAISADDPAIRELAISIKDRGIQEPVIVSRDGFIISGHRRYFAAQLVKRVLVPVLVSPVSRADDPEEFMRLLVECNSQRIKSASVLLREELLKVDSADAYRQIVNDRKEKEARRSLNNLSAIDPEDDGRRCKIQTPSSRS